MFFFLELLNTSIFYVFWHNPMLMRFMSHFTSIVASSIFSRLKDVIVHDRWLRNTGTGIRLYDGITILREDKVDHARVAHDPVGYVGLPPMICRARSRNTAVTPFFRVTPPTHYRP